MCVEDFFWTVLDLKDAEPCSRSGPLRLHRIYPPHTHSPCEKSLISFMSSNYSSKFSFLCLEQEGGACSSVQRGTGKGFPDLADSSCSQFPRESLVLCALALPSAQASVAEILCGTRKLWQMSWLYLLVGPC